MAAHSIYLVMLAGAAATYLWRGLGVALAGRIDPNGAIFRWVGCVAYALLAGLVARMIVLPVGALHATALWVRLLAALLSLIVFFGTRKNILFGALAGVGVLAILSWHSV